MGVIVSWPCGLCSLSLLPTINRFSRQRLEHSGDIYRNRERSSSGEGRGMLIISHDSHLQPPKAPRRRATCLSPTWMGIELQTPVATLLPWDGEPMSGLQRTIVWSPLEGPEVGCWLEHPTNGKVRREGTTQLHRRPTFGVSVSFGPHGCRKGSLVEPTLCELTQEHSKRLGGGPLGGSSGTVQWSAREWALKRADVFWDTLVITRSFGSGSRWVRNDYCSAWEAHGCTAEDTEAEPLPITICLEIIPITLWGSVGVGVCALSVYAFYFLKWHLTPRTVSLRSLPSLLV